MAPKYPQYRPCTSRNDSNSQPCSLLSVTASSYGCCLSAISQHCCLLCAFIQSALMVAEYTRPVSSVDLMLSVVSQLLWLLISTVSSDGCCTVCHQPALVAADIYSQLFWLLYCLSLGCHNGPSTQLLSSSVWISELFLVFELSELGLSLSC